MYDLYNCDMGNVNFYKNLNLFAEKDLLQHKPVGVLNQKNRMCFLLGEIKRIFFMQGIRLVVKGSVSFLCPYQK